MQENDSVFYQDWTKWFHSKTSQRDFRLTGFISWGEVQNHVKRLQSIPHQKKKEKETTVHALNQGKNLKHPCTPKTEYLERG